MKQSAWPNNRIVMHDQRNWPDDPDPSGQITSLSMTAPDGYHVVSGGWQQSDTENAYVTSSYPSFNSSLGSNNVGNDSWTFQLSSSVQGHGGSIEFWVICERDDHETLRVNVELG